MIPAVFPGVPKQKPSYFGDLSFDTIIQVCQEMDEQMIPLEDRWLTVSPRVFSALKKEMYDNAGLRPNPSADSMMIFGITIRTKEGVR